MTPESVGVKKTSLVMGKHSGRHAFRDKLSDMGYVNVTDDIINKVVSEVEKKASELEN